MSSFKHIGVVLVVWQILNYISSFFAYNMTGAVDSIIKCGIYTQDKHPDLRTDLLASNQSLAGL